MSALADKNFETDPGKKNISSVKGKYEKVIPNDHLSKEDKKARKEKMRREKREKRLLERKKRKEMREKRKLERKRRIPVLYDPDKSLAFENAVFFGYALRFFSIAFTVFGITYLFCDSFTMTKKTNPFGIGVNGILLLLFCTAAVTGFSLLFLGKKKSLIGLGVLAVTVGICCRFGSCNPVSFFLGGFERVFNTMMHHLDELDFASAPDISLGVGVPNSLAGEYTGGVYLIALLLSLIFSAFSARRTRILPMLIFGGGLCVFCFSYNLCEGNFGFAFTLTGACSIIVLAAYDKLYAKHRKNARSRAFSGYASALAGLLAFLIVLIPAVSINKPYREIGFLSKPINRARAYVTTVLTGGNPRNNLMNSMIETRPNELKEPDLTSDILFNVGAYTSDNIYLRSWIGGDYDVKKDEWKVISEDDLLKMQKDLKPIGASNSFTGDSVTDLLYDLFDQKLQTGKKGGQTYESLLESCAFGEKFAKSNNQFCYTSTVVDIEYVENSGLLFVLPSAFSPTFGVMEYESRFSSYPKEINLVADGMYESGWFNLFKSYSAFANVQNYKSKGYGESAEKRALYYEVLGDFILNDLKGLGDRESILAAFDKKLAAYDLYNSYFGNDALVYYLSLPMSERMSWYNKYYKLIPAYSEYVREHYTDPAGSGAVKEIGEMLRPGFEAAETTHDKIMVVMRYFKNNYTYSISPKQSETGSESALDTFLLETHDGYCVQFATAATLLLRYLGLPARYVQGYVATDFGPSDNGYRECEVTGQDAHAWVEVYIDGLGWHLYDATPTMFDSLYYTPTVRPDPDDTTKPTVVTTPDTTPEESTVEPDTDPDDVGEEKEPFNWKGLIRLIVIAAIAILVFIFLYKKYTTAKTIESNRRYFIQRAIYGTFEDQADFDLVAVTIGDCIMDVLRVAGFERSVGETPSDFARRVDAACAEKPQKKSKRLLKLYRARQNLPESLESISALISKEEFGACVSRDELDRMGTYLKERQRIEYRALNPFKKFWYRYVRYMI